jgi:hypothetical protein
MIAKKSGQQDGDAFFIYLSITFALCSAPCLTTFTALCCSFVSTVLYVTAYIARLSTPQIKDSTWCYVLQELDPDQSTGQLLASTGSHSKRSCASIHGQRAIQA